MKLSDLVKMANGADPEILIVQSAGSKWMALPLEERPNPLLGLKDDVLTIAAAGNKPAAIFGDLSKA